MTDRPQQKKASAVLGDDVNIGHMDPSSVLENGSAPLRCCNAVGLSVILSNEQQIAPFRLGTSAQERRLRPHRIHAHFQLCKNSAL